MNTSPKSKRRWLSRPVLIGVAAWALLPWFFALVYSFHPFDHADPFWLPALPWVIVSFLPMEMFAPHAHGFPLPWVAASSVFNLAAGLLVTGIAAAIRARREA